MISAKFFWNACVKNKKYYLFFFLELMNTNVWIPQNFNYNEKTISKFWWIFLYLEGGGFVVKLVEGNSIRVCFQKIYTASLKMHMYIYPVLFFLRNALPFRLEMPALVDLLWSKVVKEPRAPFLSWADHQSPRPGFKETEIDVRLVKKHWLKLYRKDVIVFQ